MDDTATPPAAASNSRSIASPPMAALTESVGTTNTPDAAMRAAWVFVDGCVTPYVHQPVRTESDGVEGVLQCAHVHAGEHTLGMGRRDQRADRIAAERREFPAEGAPVLPHDLDPV